MLFLTNTIYLNIAVNKSKCVIIKPKTLFYRCGECGALKEEYSDEELGLCIVILATFIHREPALAAPLLPEILSIVAK